MSHRGKQGGPQRQKCPELRDQDLDVGSVAKLDFVGKRTVAADGSTALMRRFLRSRGYAALGWGQGLNLGPDSIQRTQKDRTDR